MNIIDMNHGKSPILVTGSPRSGSTWVGRMLALASTVGYIQEPFNVEWGWVSCRAEFDNWFTYICKENEDRFRKTLQETLSFRYSSLREGLRRASTFGEVRTAVLRAAAFMYKGLAGRRPLMKDPIAVLSAEWLADRFDMAVLVLIRHPAAFAGSLKVAGWRFPFNHFLNQPLLLRDKLATYRSEIEEYARRPPDIVDQAGLLWRVIYDTVLDYREEHPDWIFIRHEDLSRDPLREFGRLYDVLGLDMTDRIAESIHRHSHSRGPTRLRRNSKANTMTWKDRLSRDEIARLRDHVSDVSQEFYSDEEWHLAHEVHS